MYGNNFFNPYMFNSSMMGASKIGGSTLGKGLFSKMFGKFSLSGFLTGASKTLNVVNQAIPIYYQVKPMISNAKTMFKVMNAVKAPDKQANKTSNQAYKTQTKSNNVNYSNDASPTFFI